MFTNFTHNHKVNMALLKLRDKLVFNTRVQPINLADYVPQEGSKAMLSGFGRKEVNKLCIEKINMRTCFEENVDIFIVNSLTSCYCKKNG